MKKMKTSLNRSTEAKAKKL